MTIFCHYSHAQILIIKNKNNSNISDEVKNILINNLLLPREIIHEISMDRENCEIKKDFWKYDLVICAKKNGELEFPIFKKDILETSYKNFL